MFRRIAQKSASFIGKHRLVVSRSIAIAGAVVVLPLTAHAHYIPMEPLQLVASPPEVLTIPKPNIAQRIKEALAKYFERIAEIWKYFSRILTYAYYGIPIAVLTPAAVTFGESIPGLEDAAWDYCIWAIQKLGPTFVKLAQWASTRPDLYPPKLVERLRRFQDDVPTNYPISVVDHTLSDAFGAE